MIENKTYCISGPNLTSLETSLFFLQLYQTRESIRILIQTEFKKPKIGKKFLTSINIIDDYISGVLKFFNHKNKFKCTSNFLKNEFMEAIDYEKRLEKMLSSQSKIRLKNISFDDNTQFEKIANLEEELEKISLAEFLESNDLLQNAVDLKKAERYVEKVLDGKIDQHQYKIDLKLKKVEDELLKWQNKIKGENVFESQVEWLQEENFSLRDTIRQVNEDQEITSTKLSDTIAVISADLKSINKNYTYYQELLLEHKEWVQETRRNDAARKIQNAWWAYQRNEKAKLEASTKKSKKGKGKEKGKEKDKTVKGNENLKKGKK